VQHHPYKKKIIRTHIHPHLHVASVACCSHREAQQFPLKIRLFKSTLPFRLANDSLDPCRQVTIVERKTTSRPFSQAIDQERLNHFITKKENYGFADAAVAAAVLKDEVDNRQQAAESGQVVVMNGSAPPHSKPNLDLWFKEMVELRKKAGEYKVRLSSVVIIRRICNVPNYFYNRLKLILIVVHSTFLSLLLYLITQRVLMIFFINQLESS